MKEIRIILRVPTVKYAASVMEFRSRMLSEIDGTGSLHGCALLEETDSYDEWLDFHKMGQAKYGGDYVPADVYLAVRTADDKVVGMIEFRHPLTEKLQSLAGHVGYSVLPEERGKGYATEMLRQLLPYCKASGERRIMLSCAKENEASRKVILANGGVLRDEIQETLGLSQCGIAQRYWIMLSERNPNELLDAMAAVRDPMKVSGLSRFFKTGPGQYGEGDSFLGIKVPTIRSVVKRLGDGVPFCDLEECMESPYHEVRLAALLSLIVKYKHARKKPFLQQECIDFYLAHTEGINNWDLVDLSCYELLGDWLLDKDRSVLYELAKDEHSIWKNRIGIVSTMQFIRHGQFDDTLAIAETLLSHTHDLIHKAVGWLLREVGKRNRTLLIEFLNKHSMHMPRTALRYAIEHFSQTERRQWLGGKTAN